MSKKVPNIVVAGDVNINVLNSNCNKYKILTDTLSSHSLRYLVDFPTRVTENTVSSIDNFFINFYPDDLQIIGLNTQISDHDAQFLTFKVPGKKVSNDIVSKMVRKFTEANLNMFSKMLSRESWAEVYFASVDCKFDVFYNIFMYHFDTCFPIVRSRCKNKTIPWVNFEF